MDEDHAGPNAELKNLKVSVEAHRAAKIAAAKAGVSLQDYVASAIKAASETQPEASR